MVVDPRWMQLAEEDLERAYCSFASMLKMLWVPLEGETSLYWNWHLELMCEEAERLIRGEVRGLVVNIGPGNLKSRWMTALDLWEVMRKPSRQVIATSVNEDVLKRETNKIRAVMKGPKSILYKHLTKHAYQHHGVPLWWLLVDNYRTQQTSELGIRTSKPIEGAITGGRGNLRIDDPHDIGEIIGSPAAVRRRMVAKQRLVEQKLLSRLNVADKHANWLIVAHRVDQADVSSALLEHPDVAHVILPRSHDPSHERLHPLDPRQSPGDPIHPTLPGGTMEAIAREEAHADPDHTAALHQQRPRARSGNRINEDQFRRYGCDPLTRWRQRRDEGAVLVLNADCAQSVSESACFTSFQVTAETPDLITLLDRVLVRVEGPELVAHYEWLSNINTADAMERRHLIQGSDYKGWRWPIRTAWIEQASGGVFLLQTLRDDVRLRGVTPKGLAALSRERAEFGSGDPSAVVLPSLPDAAKATRFGFGRSYVQLGRYEIPREAPWLHGQMGWLPAITNFGQHHQDDDADTFSQTCLVHHLRPMEDTRRWF